MFNISCFLCIDVVLKICDSSRRNQVRGRLGQLVCNVWQQCWQHCQAWRNVSFRVIALLFLHFEQFRAALCMFLESSFCSQQINCNKWTFVRNLFVWSYFICLKGSDAYCTRCKLRSFRGSGVREPPKDERGDDSFESSTSHCGTSLSSEERNVRVITGGKGLPQISPQTPELLVPQERAEVLTAEVESTHDRVVLR